jgi:hypothetical protein
MITVTLKAKCPRHPRFNPSLEGRGGIVGGCKGCEELCELFEEWARMARRVKEFEERHELWVEQQERRVK